jgi:serine/threonine protein phosphatase 1
MAGRTIAIGDIHGWLPALQTVLAAIGPQPDDSIVTLGDYIDRGPDSRGVIDRLLELAGQCRLIPLLGNHDQMLLMICGGRLELIGDWRQFGGDATLASYGNLLPNGIPPEHLAFLRNCRTYYESAQHFFVHASYLPEVPLPLQDPMVLLWESLRYRHPGPHCSGKIAVVGHTAQKNGEILDLGYLKCIDTYCYGSGWLTALDVDCGQTWRARKTGEA